jgi:hypothetical protein
MIGIAHLGALLFAASGIGDTDPAQPPANPVVAESTNANSGGTHAMPKSLDRNAPPHVDAVELAGTRYEQVLDTRRLGLPGDTGWLRAVDIATGKERWVKRIYTQTLDPTKERDVQLRWFRHMAPSPDGTRLRITTESGEVWSVDPATGAAERAR